MIDIQILLLIMECVLLTYTGILSYLLYKLIKFMFEDAEKKKKNSLF
jgi:hypothetical protein